MQNPHLRYKLHLQRFQIIFLFAFGLLLASPAHAQKKYRWVTKNNPNYDDRRLTYGFLIGLHSSTYQIKYSDAFVTPAFDTVYAVQPNWKAGFALGFIVNYKLTEFLDFRLTPTVAFTENELRYVFTDRRKQPETKLVESTMVEFPFLLKYKSERRGNIRMYMIGGVKPAIEAASKKDKEGTVANIEVKGSNLSLEAGFGFDLYYPLFKFSPEIRFSRGLTNILDDATNKYGQPLKSISTNTITIYLVFQ